ncbi:polyisoprenoid-binding protein [Flavobacterium sediminis]|uniref:Polyisoprenoid-binding protein n=1 Tax=Flavobacterium sediminis TaxID=2201181 RepID=A0A2U8QTF3_9FLAO|nr:YceI family protein [Flavobacterium sediminis]AWM13452.1 polyisoprenoid-binding protein [Flavobacterium sediminis]
MKKLMTLVIAFTFVIAANAQTKTQTWNVDPYHSFLTFSIKHLGISFVDGKFDQYQGTLKMTGEDVTTTNFDFSIDVNSINTGVEARDGHLKSADFFDAAKYDKITFKQTSIKKIKKNKYRLTGDLTIKNVTKSVTFELVYGGKIDNDGFGNEKVGFQATTTINRFDFGVAYDPTGQAVAKEVQITVNLEFAKQK